MRMVLSKGICAAMVICSRFFPKAMVVKASGDGNIMVSYDVVEKGRVDKHWFVL